MVSEYLVSSRIVLKIQEGSEKVTYEVLVWFLHCRRTVVG